MLLLVAEWVALFGLLVGWGLFVLSLLARIRRGLSGNLGIFPTLWLGYAGLLGFSLVLSLVMPIARPALVLAWLPALAGFAVQRRAVVHRLRELRARPRTTIVVGVVGLVAWLAVAYAACDRVTGYDTLLYHLQVVKWNATYAAVPGLANLHLRLGYDNSVHVFGALVDAFWQGEGVHATNGFLMAAVLSHWFAEILMARTPRGRLRQAFCLLTLPFLLAKLWYVEVASYSSDLPLAIFSLVLLLELISLPRVARDRLVVPVAYVLALAAVAATTKLGGMGLLVATAICAAVLARVLGKRDVIAVVALPAVIVVGWLVRNAIVSGWLIFPVFGKLPLPWAVSRAAAAEHLGWIESWARLPQQEPQQVLGHGFLHWFVPWFDGFRQSHEMILLAAAAALLAWRIADGFAVSAARRAGEWAAIGGCLLALAQWFVGAPDLRFGGFLFWALPAALLAPAIANAMRDATIRAFALAISLVACAWQGGLTPRIDDVVPPLWKRPVSPAKRHYVWEQTGPQTLVMSPLGTDQCNDAPLPCTPYPSTQTLRDPSSLGAGFYLAPGS